MYIIFKKYIYDRPKTILSMVKQLLKGNVVYIWGDLEDFIPDTLMWELEITTTRTRKAKVSPIVMKESETEHTNTMKNQ